MYKVTLCHLSLESEQKIDGAAHRTQKLANQSAYSSNFIMDSVLRKSYIALFVPHPQSRSSGVAHNIGNLLFEKMKNLEIHFEKIEISFSFQNVVKVLNSAVILPCWDPKSVV